MSYSIDILFGKEAVDAYLMDSTLTEELKELNLKSFTFETETELAAFKKGLAEGIGWMEFVEVGIKY